MTGPTDTSAAGFECIAHAAFTTACDRTEFDELIARTAFATVFDTWHWVSTAYRHLKPTEQAFVLTCRGAGGALSGCLPLKICRESVLGVPVRVARFVQYPLGDQMTILADAAIDGVVDALLSACRAHRHMYDAIILDEVRTNSLTSDMTQAMQRSAAKFGWSVREVRRTPVLNLSGQTRASLQAAYKKSLATRLKRSWKKIRALASDLTIERIAPQDVDAVIADIADVECRSWKGSEGVGIFSSGDTGRHIRGLASALAADGHLIVARIKIDGRTVTYRLAFEYAAVIYDYNLAYLEDYADLGAGRVLLDEMILTAADAGLAAFDASRTSAHTSNLVGERDAVWIAHQRWTRFSPTVGGHVLRALHGFGKPFARTVRRRLRALSERTGAARPRHGAQPAVTSDG